MWALDPANSPELIEDLRPHARDPESLCVLWVGEGWRDLVRACHQQLRAAFPDYELVNVETKDGLLAYHAHPRPSTGGEPGSPVDGLEAFNAIRDRFRDRSATVCEWCGSVGRLRAWRTGKLTLCDPCDDRFPDPPIHLDGKAPKRSS